MKKHLGQNFLKDTKILSKIADFAQIDNTDTVLEIGPGEGALTEILLKRALKVISIEKDFDLIPVLQEKFREEIKLGKFELINADILVFDTTSLPPYKLLGNIPYYITGAIFEKFLESENKPQSITFVVQKEVAERIMAKNKKESILSLSVKVFGDPEYGGIIKAGSFVPSPKVDSAIISIRNIDDRSKNIDKARFFRIVKAGFAHKRKILIKNLLSVDESLEKSIKSTFESLNLDLKVRAEDLTLKNWIDLTKSL